MSGVDGPFYEIVEKAETLVGDGASIFQRFTCEACQARQVMDVPNALYTQGACDECKHVTDLQRTGCGFMLIVGNDPVAHAAFVKAVANIISEAQPRNRN